MLDDLLEELGKIDSHFALLDSFIRVLLERVKTLEDDSLDYEESYQTENLEAVKEKIASDTELLISDSKLFLASFTRKL